VSEKDKRQDKQQLLFSPHLLVESVGNVEKTLHRGVCEAVGVARRPPQQGVGIVVVAVAAAVALAPPGHGHAVGAASVAAGPREWVAVGVH
jgi:hypothetical protein